MLRTKLTDIVRERRKDTEVYGNEKSLLDRNDAEMTLLKKDSKGKKSLLVAQ